MSPCRPMFRSFQTMPLHARAASLAQWHACGNLSPQRLRLNRRQAVIATHRGALCLAIGHRGRTGAQACQGTEEAQGHLPAVSTLVGYTSAALAAERYALLIASTYGDGDAPDGVQPFYEQLCLEHFPRFENLSYAVLALGDRHYEHFCKFGSELDAKLASLGANRLCSRIDCDVDVTEPFEQWKAAVMPRLSEIATNRESRSIGANSAESGSLQEPARELGAIESSPANAYSVQTPRAITLR